MPLPQYFKTAMRAARRDATKRGHKLGKWWRDGFGSAGAECADCGARARVFDDYRNKSAEVLGWEGYPSHTEMCRPRQVKTFGGGGRMERVGDVSMKEGLWEGTLTEMPIINDTSYDEHPYPEVYRHLENARQRGTRLRITYGDVKTGRSWADPSEAEMLKKRPGWIRAYGALGRIERSMGPVKIPLEIPSSRSTGGPGLLVGSIVKIEHANKKSGGLIWKHPNYHEAEHVGDESSKSLGEQALDFVLEGNDVRDVVEGMTDPTLLTEAKCPMCAGPGVVLGTLGQRKHFRCRNCGMDYSHNARKRRTYTEPQVNVEVGSTDPEKTSDRQFARNLNKIKVSYGPGSPGYPEKK